MQRVKMFMAAIAMLVSIGCSLPPERPVTEAELMPMFKAFEFVESPEEILAVLNKEGEVTVPAKYRGRAYYVKILATAKGLIVEYYTRHETPKEKK